MIEKSKTLVYIPAFNEEKTIEGVIKSIFNLDSLKCEVLVVDDGSNDLTAKVSKEAGAKVISHYSNKGVGKAFETALNYSVNNRYDFLVSIDADGQFDVNQILDLVNPIMLKEADFSIGDRFYNRRPNEMPKIKYWGNKRISNIISVITKIRISDSSCGFRAYSRECLISLNLQGAFTYTHETILDLLDKNFRVAQIPVKVKYFEGRVSRVANNLFRYAFKTSIIIFKALKDYKPFQFFFTIASIVFLLAVIIGGFVFYHWLDTGYITPYKSLGIFSLALLGMSVLLVILALIADMLNRIRRNQEKILLLLKNK
ncbi:glycosyltransferase family 2 protein [Zunongwangia atlantica]|uniref:Family 2 glycosyl transferase n=1 Tax=Zunongwangia atlantica 22II14-10F7 TaxID=1185767 RepID=A0A1Y1T1W7_9FLAO|nr:glycosyltransferase family 2 protein [Zunongwangia atlantica]ORL44997.1 family 2 glycosyl transferase [Zunongwangia atlantica 22II14-10F7]